MRLFGKKKNESQPAEKTQTPLSQNETSYFGKNLTIKGRISGNGNIIILGGLEGEFNLRGRVKIAQPANVRGEVRADVISVNGSVQGSLIAKERVHLDPTARIEGQITTPRLSISEGAAFDGEITMSDPLAKPPAGSQKKDSGPAPPNTAGLAKKL